MYNFTKFFVHVASDSFLVLLWQHCNTLCTSSFVDDVTFSYTGQYGGIMLQQQCW